MSNPTNDPQAGDEAIDDLDVPTADADAVTGGITFQASDDDAGGETQGSIHAI